MRRDYLPETFDGIIVGGGHNGLVAATYLARAGLSILVLEATGHVGGGATMREATLPSFAHNLHGYYLRWEPEYRIWRDLGLDRYGVRALLPPVQGGVPFDDGTRALVIYNDIARSARAIAELSSADAARFETLHAEFTAMNTRFLEPVRFSPRLPPDEERALLASSATGRRYLDLARRSPLEVVTDWFESEPLRAFLLYHVAIRGYFPYLDVADGGHAAAAALQGCHNQRIIEGGTDKLSRALMSALYDAGGLVLTSAPVAQIDVRSGRASAVTTADGRTFKARRFIASSLPPPITLGELVPTPPSETASYRSYVEDFPWLEYSIFGLHLALTEVPKFRAADEDLPRGLNLALGYECAADVLYDMERLRANEVTDRPALHTSIPTLHDPSQAPAGYSTTFSWQFVPSRPKGDDRYWDPEHTAELSDSVLRRYADYAPNVPDTVLSAYAHNPDDIERMIPSMRYGDHHHGSYRPASVGSMRPHPDLADYRTPVDGLYLCGSSQHPGGGLTGAPGFNAAGAIVDDLHLDAWWERPDGRSALTSLRD